MSKQLVLVTGVNGYLGSHVVDVLVKEGYRVRGTVRTAKVSANKEAFSVYGDDVEIVGISDLVHGSFPEVFEGVSAIIHLAAPITGKAANAEEALQAGIDGSLNILRQGYQAGVKNVSYASSIAAVSVSFHATQDYSPLSDDQWTPITKEYVLNNKVDEGPIYIAQKVYSERAVWEFAEKHPDVEVASIAPPFCYGPFAAGYKAPYEAGTLGSMSLLYDIIRTEGTSGSPFFVDTRDVARALVFALKAPPTSQVGRKRILMSSEWVQPNDIVELISKERPALASRISTSFKARPAGVKQIIDNKRLKEVLGIEPIPWQQTILDGVDALIEAEKVGQARGITLSL